MKHICNFFPVRTLFFSMLALVFTGFYGCEKVTLEGPTVNPNEPVSFSEDIIPIFNDNCISCHDGAISPTLTEGEAYDELISEDIVNTGAPAESELVVKLREGHLAGLSDFNIQKIEVWIAQGALNN